MAGETQSTTDPDVIRHWAVERNALPAAVVGTGEGREPGVLGLDFPDYTGTRSLETISWDLFFRRFEEEGLRFVYQETTKDGEMSNFFKLVSRD